MKAIKKHVLSSHCQTVMHFKKLNSLLSAAQWWQQLASNQRLKCWEEIAKRMPAPSYSVDKKDFQAARQAAVAHFPSLLAGLGRFWYFVYYTSTYVHRILFWRSSILGYFGAWSKCIKSTITVSFKAHQRFPLLLHNSNPPPPTYFEAT